MTITMQHKHGWTEFSTTILAHELWRTGFLHSEQWGAFRPCLSHQGPACPAWRTAPSCHQRWWERADPCQLHYWLTSHPAQRKVTHSVWTPLLMCMHVIIILSVPADISIVAGLMTDQRHLIFNSCEGQNQVGSITCYSPFEGHELSVGGAKRENTRI